jgi:hypothetical protein
VCQRRDLLPQRQQHAIDDHHPIVSVVDNEGELVGMQPQVERVEHASGQRNCEVCFEMLIVVPRQRGDPVAGLDAETLQGVCKAPRAGGEIAVRVPMDRPVRAACDDRSPWEDSLRVTEDRRQREREVHHQAPHAADSRSRRVFPLHFAIHQWHDALRGRGRQRKWRRRSFHG